MLYDSGLEARDLWEQAYRLFGKEKSKPQNMDMTKFYTGNKFGLVIDMRTTWDQTMHGSGKCVVGSSEGVQLEIDRKAEGSGTMKCHIYVLSDAQFDIMGRAYSDKLSALVSTGKAKEAIGVQLTHEQVKRLSDKDVEKFTKLYETYVGSKTTETLMDSFIFVVTKAVGLFVNIKDIEVYQKELRRDYIINKELSTLAGKLAWTCGKTPSVASAALITATNRL